MPLGLVLLVASSVVAQEGSSPADPIEAEVVETDRGADVSSREREAALRSEAGRLAFGRGELEQARADFDAAWALAPTVERFRDRARALEALRRDAELVALYRDFLAWAPADEPVRTEVQARLSVLESRPGAAEVSGSDAEPTVEAPTAASPRSHTVLDEPWFWAVVAVVAAAGLGAVLFGASSQGTEAPIPGDDGVVVRTLVEIPLP
jgi:tetratricopeptide (TPR) repeat protein